jgi:hypothetical protein
VTALAKIGGLFALLRLGFILNLWHENLFTRKMNEKVAGSKEIKIRASLNESFANEEDLNSINTGDASSKEDFRDVFSF